MLRKSLISANELVQEREIIDAYNGHSYFSYYSEFIEQLLRLISQVQIQLKSLEQNRASVDFLNLLNLQEKSGQERGTLNAILNTAQLNSRQLQQVISYGDAQKKLINDLFLVSQSHHQQMLQRQLNSENNQQILTIRKLLNEKLIRAEQLAILERKIGYGGLIHDFKSYILRGETSYLKNFLKGSYFTSPYSFWSL